MTLVNSSAEETQLPVTSVPGVVNRQKQRAIYQRYLPIVRRIAMRTVRSLPPSVLIDDLISAGWLGMVEKQGLRKP